MRARLVGKSDHRTEAGLAMPVGEPATRWIRDSGTCLDLADPATVRNAGCSVKQVSLHKRALKAGQAMQPLQALQALQARPPPAHPWVL